MMYVAPTNNRPIVSPSPLIYLKTLTCPRLLGLFVIVLGVDVSCLVGVGVEVLRVICVVVL